MRYKHGRLWSSFFFLWFCFFATAEARFVQIPTALQPWVDWMLYGHESQVCPLLVHSSMRLCAWTTDVELHLLGQQGQTGADLSLKTMVFAPGWFFLPGDTTHWPEAVQDQDGKAYTVLSQPEGPAVWLKAGEYFLKGHWSWKESPKPFKLPPSIGAMTVTAEDSAIAARRDEDGLWFLDKDAVPAAQERISLQIYRKLTDDVPFQIETLLKLQVSGQAREVVLDNLMLSGEELMQLDSKLAVQLESNGRLQVQVEPGIWTIRLFTRMLDPVKTLTIPKRREGLVPPTEIWVFVAKPSIRTVELEGLEAIDPKTTELPLEWQNYPAFNATAEKSLVLEEHQRAEPSAAAHIQEQRKLWLDFQGQSWTVVDHLQGTIVPPMRLNSAGSSILGRASTQGVLERITKDKHSIAGLEIRSLPFNVEVVSQVPFNEGQLAATGWDRIFQKVSAELYLPPGFRLLDVFGADTATGTWVAAWDLLDIFVVLLISGATLKLLGTAFGMLALIAMIFSYQEPFAPHYSWLWLLGATALLRVASSSFRPWILCFVWGIRIWILGLLLIFSAFELRTALYPQLREPLMFSKEQLSVENAPLMGVAKNMMRFATMAVPAPLEAPVLSHVAPQEGRSTGPGIPEWTTVPHYVEFHGPVLPEQKIHLWILGPWMNAVWQVIAAMAATYLLYALWRKGGGAILCILVLGYSMFIGPVQADIPDEALREELQARLLQAPACVPDCVQVATLRLKVDQDALALALEVHAGAPSALPIAKNNPYWLPTKVFVNDALGATRFDDQQQLIVAVPEGVSTVRLEGRLQGLEKVALWLPLVPKQAQIELGETWKLLGVPDQPILASELQLERQGGEHTVRFGPSHIEPFVRVNRILKFDQQWTMQTLVERMAPFSGPLQLQLALIPVEQVLTPGFKIESKGILLNFDQDQRSIRWDSQLPIIEELSLVASDDPAVYEEWVLQPSELWSLETAGLTPLQDPIQGLWKMRFRPWPKQALTVRLKQTELVPANTYTIERYEVNEQIGSHAKEYDINLRINSSIGDNYPFLLPEGLEVLSVEKGGVVQALDIAQKSIRLSLSPGKQDFQLHLRQTAEAQIQESIGGWPVTMNAYNIHLQQSLATDRFLVWVRGPTIGPAILYWGVLIVLVALSVALSCSKMAPLGSVQWFLLGVGFVGACPLSYLVLVAWFFAMGAREKWATSLQGTALRFTQCGLVLLSIWMVYVLFEAISAGLLGTPDMMILGNGSTENTLNWYQESMATEIPRATSWSVPMWVYRAWMLMWALWLTARLLRWIPWGWRCFVCGGAWPKSTEIKAET